MLQACLNGGRSDAVVPATAEALAKAAIAARSAGADEFHVHPRNGDGAESLEPDDVANCLDAIRAAVPGAPVGVGTGAWISPGGRARHEQISNWVVRPDYASVNLNEEDAPDVMRILTDNGQGIEAGVWRATDARRLVDDVDPATCLRVLVEMPDVTADEALAEADATIAVLRDAGVEAPVLLHGLGRSAWACIKHAAETGHDTRVGFEDVLHLPDGRLAADNGELVAAAREILSAARAGAT